MDSNRSTTRTYTALTCTLTVSTAKKHNFGIEEQQLEQAAPIDFTLDLVNLDRPDLDPISLKGQFYQLDRLQQVVSKYITTLVAKFPSSIMNNTKLDQPKLNQIDRDDPNPQGDSVKGKLYPGFNQSGLINNLPGLRNSSITPTPDSQPDSPSSGISKLFGGWKKSNQRKNSQPAAKQQYTPLGAAASVKSTDKHEPEVIVTPHLTATEGSLDHQLHLGDLATEASGEVIALSPIQLFDLSTVVDEHAADVAKKIKQVPSSTTFSRANIPGDPDRFTDPDPTAASLSRLPNLPKISTRSQGSQVYNRTRHNNYERNSSFMSVVPWAAAAAIAVGGSLLLLDSKPNPLKDATSKVKMPDLEGVKNNVSKTVTAAMSPPVVDPEPTTGKKPDLPKAWENQSVQPPQTTTKPVTDTPAPSSPKTLDTITPPSQSIGKIGIAPLPDSIGGKPAQDLPTAGVAIPNPKPSILSILPRNNVSPSGIAPNPLSTTQLPSETTRIPSNTGLPTSLRPITTKPGVKTASIATPTPGKITETLKPGTVSVSTQPILLPSDLPGIGINPGNSPQPLNPVKSSTVKKSPAPKTTNQKVKPTVATKPAKSTAFKPIDINPVRQPLFEPFNIVPSTPTYTSPTPIQTTPENNDFQNQPVGPTPAFPDSSNANLPEPATESPSLQETKRYFQSKWKPSKTQSSPLQYVVQVSSKTGLVRNVAPQGAAAVTYLQQSKLIRAGQKLVSPSAASTPDQKIRVILQVDGNVDTFIEP